MEMLHGFLQRSAVLSAVREGSGDADRTEGIQAVSILNDLSFEGTRCLSAVLAEGYCVDSNTNLVNDFFRHLVFREEGPGVCIVLGMKQLVVVCIVKERRKRCDFLICFRLFLCNLHCISVHTKRVRGIMSIGVAAKEFLDIGNSTTTDGESNGIAHGGCIYTLAGVTVGNAASSYGMTAPTLEGGLHFLASSKGTKKLRAVAEEMHHGKTIMVFSVSVFDDAGKTIASGTFSFFNTKRAFSF